jgi:hypothetical protein
MPWYLLLCIALLAGCSTAPGRLDQALGTVPGMPAQRDKDILQDWRHQPLPGKSPTQFSHGRSDGRDVVEAVATSSASLLRRKLHLGPQDLGTARFSWRVPELIAGADMGLRDADDSPVRIILAFEGDRSQLSQRDALLSELALTLTGEAMPYATLMYVWCNTRPAGTILRAPRSDRVRKLVVESGPAGLGRWLDYERDISADFERAFGEKPGALVGVAIMTDTDNTRSTTRAWYGPVRLGPPSQSTR